MGYKHFLITEAEKKNILSMYNVLTEQVTATTPTTQYFKTPNGGTAQVILNYGPGDTELNHTDKYGNVFDNTSKIKPIIDSATKFLTSNKGYIPRVVLYAGESIIPGKPLGTLSEERRKKIATYVKGQLQSLVDKKLISKEPEIVLIIEDAKTLTEPSGGWDSYRTWARSTPEQKAANPNNAEYTKLKAGYDKDQFSKLQFKIVPDLGPNQCTFNVKIGVHYDNLSLGHKCNAARFQILANGVPLTTGLGTTCGTGLKYADMNNGGGSLDCKKNEVGGARMNYFTLSSAALVNQIMAASSDKNSIKITMKCTSTGFDDAAGRCHQDVPHITIHNTDNVKTVDTYPNANDAVLITIDKCGNLISGGGGVPTKSSDTTSGATKTTTTTTTGKKLEFAAMSGGTLTSDQVISNKVTNGELKKNTDNTYTVLKPFVYNNITYKVNDIIVKVLPKGTVISTTTTTTTVKPK
ncbi:MAG: hypothetical protein ACKOW2_03885 [Sphingobacteriaceae bacterium]